MKGAFGPWTRKIILSSFREDGGAVLDGVAALVVVLIFILILVHFGFNLSNIISSLKKFIGVIL
ncbi:MAG: hypothetical protein M1556_01265 [Candidatus Thermoplasmatota archaeon]|jgi:hypothetical protein|nr:hypothetical protein [Candidatus Thermoplasmatota archaeon]